MPNLKELLVKEQAMRLRLDRSINNGISTPLERRTRGYSEAKLNELKKLWTEYEELDQSINELLCKTSSHTTHKYITENYFGTLESKYCEYVGELLDHIRNLSEPLDSTHACPFNTTTMEHEENVLPKIAIPKFNGDYDTWRSFYDLFTTLVHQNTRLKPVQKLYYLKGALVGDAEKLLRHTPITNEDYLPALTKLKERYENKRILTNHQLKLLTNQQKLTTETATGLKSLLDTTEECLQQLRSLKVDTSSWDLIVIHIIVQKLPFATLKLWEESQGASHELPTYQQFKTFLETRLRVLESITDTLTSKPNQNKIIQKNSTKTYHAIKANKCSACHDGHPLHKCKKFQTMDVRARTKLVLSAGRCYNCLSNEHSTRQCSSKYRCQKCNQRHHTLLHNNSSSTATKSTIQKPTVEDDIKPSQMLLQQSVDNKPKFTTNQSRSATDLDTTQAYLNRELSQTLLSTALVVAQTKTGEPQILRCLVDSGSESSFITKEACSKLQASCTTIAVTVTGLNSSQTSTSTQQTKLKLHSAHGRSSIIEDNFLVIDKITNNLPTTLISRERCKHLNKLKLADPFYWKPAKIDALLGANIYSKIICEGVIKGTEDTPTAIKTIFGWILFGAAPSAQTKQTTKTFTTQTESLEEQIKRFWEIEEVATKPILKPEELQCEEYFNQTHKRLPSGRYQVKLPFINNQLPSLGESRPQATKRFEALQRQFSRKPKFKADYEQCLDEYLMLDHMEAVDVPKEGELHYYIPHHAVYKESSTTKLRVVFDASARTSNGMSLNQQLLKGPTLQPTLFTTLLNWRKYKIVINADIEKMYRMIEVHPEHQGLQRIIWRNPTTGKLQDYKLKTVTFGTTSAPYLAIKVIQQLAIDEQHKWPLAAKAIFENFYVDDLLSGADDVQGARELQTQLIELMASAGFNLRKWSSNDVELLRHLPPEHLELKNSLVFVDRESVKTLGIKWFPHTDEFSVVIKPISTFTNFTKRTILSNIASLYDPLGWLAPIIVTAKLLMQELWITGTSWDNPVSSEISCQWKNFISELPKLENLRIPRWLRSTTNSRLQIHGFCDASCRAYAAAVYIRAEHDDGSIFSNLLTSKTKVAPIKPTTIPRLELNGAVLLTKLIKNVVQGMHFKDIPIIAWTDSTIVLQWIKEHPSKWKTYVANRIVEIQATLKYENWRHIPTKYNPADLASRGISADKLLHNDMWWHGPNWLLQDEVNWPKTTEIESTTLESKEIKSRTFLATCEQNLLLKYSSFTRLVRIIATIQRFIHNCRNPQNRKLNMLTNAECTKAEKTILRLVQLSSFAEDYDNLSQQQLVAKHSKLLTLSPLLDADGLIRVGGRLANATIPFNRKHPIILPRDHHVTYLIIDKIHLETLHGNVSLVLNTSRNSYWILDARRCITSRLHKCITCFKQRQIITTQLMGNLPSARVNITKPFSKVGIDYAGPITIKASSLRNAKLQKAYFCVFICMATKAIHIELVSQLTSEAFLAALKRFIARRGLCTDIYSDCGTNFVGGKAILDNDLKQAIKEAEPYAIQFLNTKSINWHMNPPAAPHFGGLWEASIKSIKYHLRRVIGTSKLTFEEYTTILAQVEACLNSRPLCHIRNNAEDNFVLTPGHFLIGQPLNALPEPDYSSEKLSWSNKWKHLQQLVQQFWKHWSKDYLNQLQQRPKWLYPKQNLQNGDIVLLRNENTAPTFWPLGVIEATFPGNDGLVRVVEVRTQANTFRRPVAKICKLPIENSQQKS